MSLNSSQLDFKSFGLKSTNARVAVLALLEKEDKPMDVQSILNYLKIQGLNTDQATIYRILDLFYKKGIINRIEFGEGKFRYEISSNHHHHLICKNCGLVEDVEGDFIKDIEDNIKKTKQFLIKSHSLEFFGICRNCQS